MLNQSRRLKQPEKELLALGEEVMLLEELDGFLAGILVCPQVIPPSEWLPVKIFEGSLFLPSFRAPAFVAPEVPVSNPCSRSQSRARFMKRLVT